MKELFERHRPRMTPEEDRELWGRLEQKLARSRWQAWRIPAGATALATAAVAVVVLVRGTDVSRPVTKEGLEVRELSQAQKPADARHDAPASAPVPEPAPIEADSPAPSSPQSGSSLTKAQDELAAAQPPSAMSLDARANAPAGTITGRVTNDRGEPLEFVSVLAMGLGAMTDSTGAFTILDLPPGQHTLRVSFLGYGTQELRITLEAGATLAENFILEESAVATMSQVVVDANSGVVRRDVSAHTSSRVGKEELERLPEDTFADATGAKKSATSETGAIHFRGEQTGEANTDLSSGDALGQPMTLPPSSKPDWAFIEEGSSQPISVGGTDPVNGQAFDAMFFEHYGVNPFIDPQDDRYSTFAVDVDNASYTLARSYFQRGALPPKEAIRVEEFVNSFRHDYAPPRGDLVASREWGPSEHGTFAIHLEAAPSPFGKDLVLLRVGLKGKEVSQGERKPAVLTFVVDVSGSMQQENRLELVKRALGLLLDQMDRRDRVALVVYGSEARVILPHTSLAERRVIEEAIARLHPEGSTNAEAGLRQGYALADRSFERGHLNRVILCSDGVANVGRTGAEGILGEIKTQARRGIYLTTVGFGMGNYNDVLMEKLANQGDGNYYYVDDLGEARRVFVENLTGTLQTIARDTKIQVEFDSDQVRRYRLLGYENRDVADKDFRNDAVDAGEVGAGHEVTALYEMKLDRGARGALATVRIRYEDPESGKVTEEARTLKAEDVNRRLENADPTFRLDAAVAEFAEILRHSYWAKDGDLARVHGLAREASHSVGHPEEAREVLSMIETADRLWPSSTPTQWRDDIRPQWEPEEDVDER